MKIGVLTSSRADFGIYIPLLEMLEKDSKFELRVIVFGTHLSKRHGYTLDEIKGHAFSSIDEVQIKFNDDSPSGISKTYAETCMRFASYWVDHQFDLVFCLGDRFEMHAAVQAGIPMQIKFAHIHGGETTEGAIDNIYRHQLSLASQVHFTSTDLYANRVYEITKSEQIYHVGSLSLDGFKQLELPSIQAVSDEFNIPREGYILATFHPETVSIDHNEKYVQEMTKALKSLLGKFPVVITMPNADTMGSLYRTEILRLKEKFKNLFIVESFGKLNYFTAMKNALCILGNSSSAIIEAASLNKYVVNVGDRQLGRMQSENVLDATFDAGQIKQKVYDAIGKRVFHGSNVYYKENVANSIIEIIKSKSINAGL